MTDQIAPAGEGSGPDTFVHEIRVGWGDCDPAKIAYTGRLPAFALEAIDAWVSLLEKISIHGQEGSSTNLPIICIWN